MKRISLFLLSVLFCGAAQASSINASIKPDLIAGEAKATQLCMACHAANGTRGAPPSPILQGQHPDYLLKQLREFKEGKRKNAVMSGMAAALSDADMRNVAAFYASKKAKPGAAKSEELKNLGEKIFRGGLMEKSVAACAACHSPNGAGMPTQYPRLAGQHRDYTKAQLLSFRQGERTNSNQMTAIAANLSDKEIDALSDFIAGLQ